MKELKLVLKKKWYDMIASGEKKEEYREITGYWITRINNAVDSVYSIDNLGREQTHTIYAPVTFYLGYSKERPSMTFEIKDIILGRGKEEWGAELGKDYFVIKLGERL